MAKGHQGVSAPCRNRTQLARLFATCNSCIQHYRSQIVQVEYQGQTRNTRILEHKPWIDLIAFGTDWTLIGVEIFSTQCSSSNSLTFEKVITENLNLEKIFDIKLWMVKLWTIYNFEIKLWTLPPSFCAQPSEVAMLFDSNLSRLSFLGQVVDLDLLLCTGFDLEHFVPWPMSYSQRPRNDWKIERSIGGCIGRQQLLANSIENFI